jgi:hypothetical protein
VQTAFFCFLFVENNFQCHPRSLARQRRTFFGDAGLKCGFHFCGIVKITEAAREFCLDVSTPARTVFFHECIAELFCREQDFILFRDVIKFSLFRP